MNNQIKLIEIARHLGELNKKGQVKGFKGNEKGYAKVKQIMVGCSIWVHHEKNGDLIIDLLVSPSAKEKNETKCENTVKKFEDHFGFNLSEGPWSHSIDDYQNHDRYFVIINNLSLEEILGETEKLKIKFA